MLTAILFVASALADPQVRLSFFRAWHNHSESVQVELFVDPDGEVLECDVLYTADELAESTALCENLIGKDMGKGARDSDGNRVHGTIVMGQANRKTVKQSFYDFEVEPDLEVLVEKLPESLPKKRVDVLALIDEQGQVQECAPATEEDVRLGGVACVQAKQYTLGIKLSEEGTPVRYITTVAIDFLVQESQMTAET